MKIGIIIPDRGDRPEFLKNCLRMMAAQTLQPEYIRVVDYEPTSLLVDIVPRIKMGYLYYSCLDVDLIAVIENDDWYSPDYLMTMADAWKRFERPDLFGTCYTVYYHLGLRAYNTMEHHQRSSLMNTFIKPNLDIQWPVDIEPYLDLHLWQMPTIKSRIVFRPDKHISIGMKHNVGLCGGALHAINEKAKRLYQNPDNGFLEETVDAESFEFYKNILQ